MKPWLVPAFLALLWPLGAGVGSRQEIEEYQVPEAYEVYSVLLPQEWTWRDAHARLLVIRQETDSQPFFTPVRDCLGKNSKFVTAHEDVIRSFEQANQSSTLLESDFHIQKPYQLVPKTTIEQVFNKGGWESFYDDFPDSFGYLDVSAVGFNPEKTEALVYIGHSCGLLCGGGTYHYLELKNGKWREQPIGRTCSWVS